MKDEDLILNKTDLRYSIRIISKPTKILFKESAEPSVNKNEQAESPICYSYSDIIKTGC